jgi:hypothetical protein
MNRWTLLLVVGVVGGCGGAIDSPLLDDSGTGGPEDSSVLPDSGKQDGGPVEDAVVDVPVIEDVVVVDVPVGPPDSKIHCGPSLECSAQNEVCCATVGTPFSYACVGSLNDCSGQDQIPINCSSGENCASEGQAGFICCASPGGPPNPNATCNQFETASQVMCQQSCDPQQGEFEVGCNPNLQNCTDNTQSCITSKCTLPGYGICQ